MGKKDKKKGKGAEKTAKKTEKKTLSKIKKKLAAKGEDDIEKLIHEFQERSKQSTVGEELCSQPSPRSGFSFCHHPDKEELVLFGGEYYNGKETTMYNDLFFYNIKKDQWSILQCPLKPPPRCSHQVVVLSQGGGQLWLFGGEFASPTRSNFYHYNDLWVFHFAEKRWEQVKAPGGPSSRSGHRMAVTRKQIVVFGGFHETIQDYKYFNDVHIFNLETYTWSKIEPVGKVPSLRSGVQMAPLIDGRILIYGGYSREKVKKDVDKGIAYNDMYYLHIDERTVPHKWKWVQVKPSGIPPSPRSGLTLALASNNIAFAFGGVKDEDPDEENLTSIFHNDLFRLDLEKGNWMPVTLHGNKVVKKKRRKVKGEEGETLEQAGLSDEEMEEPTVTTYDDSIFTVKIGASNPAASTSQLGPFQIPNIPTSNVFIPPARMNASLVVKNGILYLYGGMYEEGDRRLTLSDFYALDIHKLSEWKTIVPYTTSNLEWIESEDSDSEGSDSDDEEEYTAANNEDNYSGSEEEMDTQ